MKAASQPREDVGKYRLWVHCPGLLESQLTEYFGQFGNILDIYLPRDRHNGSRKNFGFATFEDEEGLQRTLAAGSEHIIAGKTVRVNVAGPRPELPLLYLQPGRVQQPMAPPPPPAGLTGAAGGMGALGGDPQSAATRGSGPRIYVGGIPTAVSETMVRNHFTQWGQVVDVYFPKDKYLNRRKNFCFVTFATQQAAEKAAAQSDREINGYRIESISITHDRQEHYQRQSVVAPHVGPASYGGGGQGSVDRSGMRWMGTARGAYGAGGANLGGGPAGNLGGISSLSVPMAAMSIGGAGQPRWPMAAAAGANSYLYGGMGGAVGGYGYGDLQQQPVQQQQMLHGGVPYGSMDAMFSVGGQLAQGGQLGSGQLLDEDTLRYMDPGAGALNYGQLEYTMPGGMGMSSDRIPTSMMLAGGVPYAGGAYFDAGLAAGMGPTMTNLPHQGQVTMSNLQQQTSLQQQSSQMLPAQHSLSSLASSPGTGSAAAALAEAHSAHSGQLDSIISPAAAAHILASSRSLPLPQQQPQPQGGPPGGSAPRAGYPSRPQPRSQYP